MVLGISMPRIFKNNPRIVSALKETEKLASAELGELEDITRLLKDTYQRLFDAAEHGKIRIELEKDYADVEKVDVILPYLKDILSLLESARSLVEKMQLFNIRIRQKIVELNDLLVMENKRLANRILSVKYRPLANFQKTCEDMIEQRFRINGLLLKVLSDIQAMIKTLELGMKDVSAFDNSKIIGVLSEIKRLFAQSVADEAQILGIEKKSLNDILEFENLPRLIFDEGFFSEADKVRKIASWNNRINAMAKTYIAFYSLVQIVTPALVGGIQFDPGLLTRVDKPAIHAELKNFTQDVFFSAADGHLISGMLIKNQDHAKTSKAIIFVHGILANSTQQEPYIKILLGETKGIDFLSINLRGSGPDSSGGFYRTSTLGLEESYDVVGAINYLKSVGYGEVIVYGYSLGGAAVLNAVGGHQDLISKDIKIKGVIVEKTFASADKFYRDMYFRFSSNFGAEALKGYGGGKEYSQRTFAKPSEFQWKIAKAIMQTANGYQLENNNPSESAKKIDAPLLAIGSIGGDAIMDPNYMRTIANSAPHGTALIVESTYKDGNLMDRHAPENQNPQVLNTVVRFINQVF